MGCFITFEGVEGVGKSTQCAKLAEALSTNGQRVVQTREPGGTALGEKLRAILLDASLPSLGDTSELLLMFAARAEHLETVIRPELDKGCHVICDRFTDATFAYQGGGRGIEASRIAELETFVQGDLRPDITVLLDLPVGEGLARAAKRSERDRFEKETVAFFERIRRCYLQRAEREPDRFVVIDASADIDAVATQVLRQVSNRLPS